MKIIKINREMLKEKKFNLIDERVEDSVEKVNMDKELGDVIFKLFQSVQNGNGSSIGSIMGYMVSSRITNILLRRNKKLTNLEEMA